MNMKSYFITISLLFCFLSAGAQEQPDTLQASKEKKAWEIGLGGTVFQFSRVGFSNFSRSETGYAFDMALNHAVWGGEIYAARELNRHLYLDLQGYAGMTNKSIEGKNKFMFMAGIGLQWRLGEYFKSRYIDPYLRAGVNYMYKDFSIIYDGSEGLAPDEMQWVMSNIANKEGRDLRHLVPISLGGGVNFWLNDRLGIGLQADYLLMPYGNVANSLQGSAKIIWRFGGKSKKTAPVVRYVDRPVEKVVEKVTEKIVEVPVERIIVQTVGELFDRIYFDFDSYEVTAESAPALDKIAETFMKDTEKRYLITGQTDAKGTDAYNDALSEKRAQAVVEELVKRGCPAEMMKSRGIGKKTAIASPESGDNTRGGDRKVTVELVNNADYWNAIP